MSHFTVLVVGEPGKSLEEQLAPFHEFECTGENDEYVQDVDITDKIRQSYETDTVFRLRDPEGRLHDPWDDRFYREVAPEGYDRPNPGYTSDARERFVPEGWEEVKPIAKDAISLIEYINESCEYAATQEPDIEGGDMFGYILTDADGVVVKVIHRTNPNAQWDWWQVGGRWSGFFRLKPGVKGELGEREPFGFASLGEDLRAGYADTAKKGDIDFDAMRDEAGAEAGQRYDSIHAVVAGRELPNWNKVRAKHGDDTQAASKEYNIDPVVVDLRKAELWNFMMSLEQYEASREVYVQRARNKAGQTFAILKDGQWYQRGEMGWWGMATDKMDEDAWFQKVSELIDGLPDDTVLSLVDCHI